MPRRHIMILDVSTGQEQYLDRSEKAIEAERVGFECVPLVWAGKVESVDQLKTFLGRDSVLGGQSIEGVVLKPMGYDVFGKDGKALMAKYVSEKFKERHGSEWKKANPGKQDVVRAIIDQLKTEARWEKAIQHLRDAGELQGAPQDIGPLLKELNRDMLEEEQEFIETMLSKWAMPQIRRGLAAGFAEWYKERLAKQQFEGKVE